MKLVKSLKTTLYSPLTASASSVVLSDFDDMDGTNLAMSDFGDWGVIVIKQGTTVEIIKFSGLTQNSNDTATLTVATNGRSIAGTSPYAGASTGEDFQVGAEVIVSNDPLTLSRFANLDVAGTFTAIMTFSAMPATTAGNPVASNDLARKAYVDSVVAGIATTVNLIVPGTAGETLAAGNLIYFDDTDNEWKLCDADTAASVENVMLGIAQGAGTDGVLITSGVLLRGLDANQSSLTAGAIYYASNTAGGLSSSAGTTEVTIGFAYSATQLYFNPRFNQQLTEDQQDALGGNVGTPSASNKFVTEEGGTPAGAIIPYAGFSAPTGWLLADGAAVSRTTYATLFGVINPSLGAATMTIASPCVVTLASHGLVLDDTVYFTTTGALPTGVSANTQYFVISAGLTASEFQFSATKGGAAINSSGSQSGVHTLRRSPYGVGDGSTTFTLPNLKGSIPVGRDSSQTEFNAVGETGGAKTHTLLTAEMPAHTHTQNASDGGGGAGAYQAGTGFTANVQDTGVTDSTGSDTAHNNLQPYISLNYIIKT